MPRRQQQPIDGKFSSTESPPTTATIKIYDPKADRVELLPAKLSLRLSRACRVRYFAPRRPVGRGAPQVHKTRKSQAARESQHWRAATKKFETCWFFAATGTVANQKQKLACWPAHQLCTSQVQWERVWIEYWGRVYRGRLFGSPENCAAQPWNVKHSRSWQCVAWVVHFAARLCFKQRRVLFY